MLTYGRRRDQALDLCIFVDIKTMAGASLTFRSKVISSQSQDSHPGLET